MKKAIKFLSIITVFIVFVLLFLICYFKITAPEGSTILQHYCFGNGKDLELESDYLPNSPVIISKLKKMRVGQEERVRFKQNLDWRLSYALNPFQLVKKQNGFEIYQYIKFDNKGKDVTEINLHLLKFKVKDSWVHLIKTTPFMVRYHYENKK
jgi:hypothetical protein